MASREKPSSGKSSARSIIALCMRGDWTGVDAWVKGLERIPQDVFLVDEETGMNCLHYAVRENKLIIVEKMLDIGFDINEPAKDGRTAAHFSAAFSREEMVRLLIGRKADFTLPGGPRRQLPLHMACTRSSGVIPIVQQIVKQSGKDGKLVTDKDGAIPLFYAVECKNLALVRELLSSHTSQQIRATKRTNKDTALHIAARQKDLETMKFLVESGADVNQKNGDGQTVLHISSSEGDDASLRFLYQVKASVNVVDKKDRTPLHLAAEKGHTSVFEYLVDKFKADVSARTEDGSTMMHIASNNGHAETAQACLRKGVPLHMPNKSGEVSLHAAAKRGHVVVVRALLEKGAHVDQMSKIGYTALHLAVENGKPLVIQALLGFGAAVELKGGEGMETPLHIAARIKDGEKCAEMLLKSGANVNAEKQNGETAMHIAARCGFIQMVKLLIQEGGNIFAQSKAGETPFHVTVRYCHYDLADFLLNYIRESSGQFELTLLINTQNVEGETSVHYAAEMTKTKTHREFEDVDMIRLLLQNEGDVYVSTKLTVETPVHYVSRAGNADVLLEIVHHLGPTRVQTAINKQAKNGWSPLLVASEQGHLEIVKILLKNGARVDVFDEHGQAALHLACENGNEEVSDVLLWHKAFVNAKNKLGVSPLHLSAANGFNKLLKSLVETHGAAVDALTLQKRTPLHMGAQAGQMKICHSLLKMNADPNNADAQGQTPLHLAAESDHSEVVKLFLKHKPELVALASSSGMTCAHIAASQGSVAVLKELMKFNKQNVISARNKTNNSTPLHLAAAGGHTEAMSLLLDAGASAKDENADGMAVIHLAAKFGHTQVLESLKDANWRQTSTKSGFTALHLAAHYGQIEFVREMLNKVPATVKSEPPHGEGMKDIPSESGLTPLHLAAQSGQEGIVRLLLNSPGVQVDSATIVTGSIPLHLAAQNGHSNVVSLLLSKSTTQLGCRDKKGRTALHLAASNGHYDMVGLLMGQGAESDSFDKAGWTPLHYAAKAGHLDVVKFLVESGSNPNHQTRDGKVALCYAAAMQHTDVVAYLLTKDHNTEELMNEKKFTFDLMLCGKLNDNLTIQQFVLCSSAPVETAARLSYNYVMLALKEKERSKELLDIAYFCEVMGTELLALAASTSSARELLKAVDSRGMQFLDILIETEMKEVVAHPAVQKYLTDIWMGHLAHWSSFRVIVLFVAFLFIPLIWIWFSLPTGSEISKVPIVKFMAYLVSHLYLIMLFSITTCDPFSEIYEKADLIPEWYEWLLLAWLSGVLVSELTNPGDKAGLGWVRVIILTISAIAVNCHLLAILFIEHERLTILYIRNQFFALSLLLCFVQMLEFLSFHHMFGPWAIIIRDLMKDLLRFMVILLLFVVGFTLEMAAAYKQVYPSRPLNASLGDGQGGADTLNADIPNMFEMLFFSLFGLVEPETLPNIAHTPDWSVKLVKGIFGAYMIVSIIVLINLLIAMMSDTYQRIQAQSDTEWKFGRAKLIRNMNRTSSTPSPLNLFTKLITYLRVACKYRGKMCTPQAQDYIDQEEGLDNAAADSRSIADVISSNPLLQRNKSKKVAPDGSFMVTETAPAQAPARRIEDIVDWSVVVAKYKSMHGIHDEDDRQAGFSYDESGGKEDQDDA